MTKSEPPKARRKNSNRRAIEPIDLEIIADGDGLAIALDGLPMKTENGHVIHHDVEPLLKHMIEEFDGYGTLELIGDVIVDPDVLTSYRLFNVQKTWVESRTDDLALRFEALLIRDPMLRSLPGPEEVARRARWKPIDAWLGDELSPIRVLAEKIPGWLIEEEEEDFDPLALENEAKNSPKIRGLRKEYEDLTPEQRVSVMMLFALHSGPVLLPLALVIGKCTAPEYAIGILAIHGSLTGTFGDVKSAEHSKEYQRIIRDAITCLEYVRLYRKGTVGELAALGESVHREFKSTLRWDIREGKKSELITQACMKTIAAFLNSEGGTLVIGVNDAGEAVGIEMDGFENDDKFLLHLFNVAKSSMGVDVSALIEPSFDMFRGKKVCVVRCKRSPSPVYLRSNQTEDFFIRTGPSSEKLPPSALVRYVTEHFREHSHD